MWARYKCLHRQCRMVGVWQVQPSFRSEPIPIKDGSTLGQALIEQPLTPQHPHPKPLSMCLTRGSALRVNSDASHSISLVHTGM